MNNRLPQHLTIMMVVLLLTSCAHPPRSPRATAPDNGADSSVIPSPSIEPDASYRGAPDFRSNRGSPQMAGVFPRPPELEPQVDFWRKVYGVWKRSQVVVHDDRYLNVIYEIIDLPGEINDGYTPAQKELLSGRRNYWEYRLRALEQKQASGAPLNADEKSLATQIVKGAHSESALNGVSERLRTQRGLRERFKRGLEISGRYDRMIRETFRHAGLPEDLAFLPHVESSFQANAYSSAGAVGIWQFTLTAARSFMNVDAALDERLDPVAAARGAARYLGHAYNKLGSWPLALTSYNHGIGGVQRAKNQFGHDFARIVKDYDHPLFGFASRNFYAEFLAARDVAGQPERFFPEGVRFEPPLNWDRIVLRQRAPVSAVARQYGADRLLLAAMNPAWTEHAKADKVPLPAGTEVWLPPGTLSRLAQR